VAVAGHCDFVAVDVLYCCKCNCMYVLSSCSAGLEQLCAAHVCRDRLHVFLPLYMIVLPLYY
jgi:hypothetical protein